MPKNDFGLDENYSNNNQMENNSSQSKNSFTSTFQNNWYNTDYNGNSDFNVGKGEYNDFINNPNIVFEENMNETTEEKIKYKLSIINKNVVIFVGILILLISIIIGLIVLAISRYNSSYKSEIIMPEVVYLGETSNISVIAQGKNNLEQTTTKFSSSNEVVATIIDKTKKGRDVLNTIVPIQEGKFTIEVKSTLKNRNMGSVKKEIQVCPSFTSDLIYSKSVSLEKGSTRELNIDFGEGKCTENIFYESSNEDIMTVTNKGEIKGVNEGGAILTVRRGQRFFSVPVYVTKEFISMTSLTANPSKIQLLPNQNVRLKISYLPYNTTTQNISFYSDNSSVVSISDTGLITALKEGTANIKISNGNKTASYSVTVVVAKGVSEEGSLVTDINLSENTLNIVQGNSEKILATVSPDNSKDKTITWSTSNSTIATVNSSGVVYAKETGTAVITAKTSNGISKNVEVIVSAIKSPIVKSSDGVASNNWHKKAYTLNFSGSESGVTYYYGTSESDINKEGKKIKIEKDESVTYYVKACRDNVCSGTVTYNSKLDTTKPVVMTVAGIESSKIKEDLVHIALKDVTSLIRRWCVTTSNNSSNCKWTTVSSTVSPVVKYTVRKNGTYYVFTEDNAGNVSDGLSFEISNIG